MVKLLMSVLTVSGRTPFASAFSAALKEKLPPAVSQVYHHTPGLSLFHPLYDLPDSSRTPSSKPWKAWVTTSPGRSMFINVGRVEGAVANVDHHEAAEALGRLDGTLQHLDVVTLAQDVAGKAGLDSLDVWLVCQAGLDCEVHVGPSQVLELSDVRRRYTYGRDVKKGEQPRLSTLYVVLAKAAEGQRARGARVQGGSDAQCQVADVGVDSVRAGSPVGMDVQVYEAGRDDQTVRVEDFLRLFGGYGVLDSAAILPPVRATSLRPLSPLGRVNYRPALYQKVILHLSPASLHDHVQGVLELLLDLDQELRPLGAVDDPVVG